MFPYRAFPKRSGILFILKNNVKRCFASKVDKDDMEKGLAVSESNQKKEMSKPRIQPPDENYLEKMNQKDKSLNERLKNVFVTSQKKNTLMDLPKHRPLPISRTSVTSVLPHSQEVEKRTPNKLLVKEIQNILFNHKKNPDEWTVEYIAERYGIESERIELMLSFYGSYNTFLASRPGETNECLLHKEPEDRIQHDTSMYEMERILTKNRSRKWLTIEEVVNSMFPSKKDK